MAKRKTLAALDLRPEYAQWLTTDDKEARVQVPDPNCRHDIHPQFEG